ncbi:MAG: site-2 protease family protein [Patescibacteria group bacterium]|nr:site-2 protease family protein [Patescibacteria group bacterium]
MDIILQITILIFSVVIHEVSHGYAAYFLGDPTAKYAGRLSFNPLKHLDPWGSVIIPLLLIVSNAGVIFGWAKPVPYNPYNLRSQKYGSAIVGAAGPLSNLALALIAGVLMRTFLVLGIQDGFFLQILATVILINILLFVFNLLPIPPLDGSKLLFAVLPVSEHTKMVLDQYGFVILLAFLFLFLDVLRAIIFFVLQYFTQFVVGIGLMDFVSF